MFNKIKQLSLDTAVYGVSTIIGRFLNFLLVPFYTNVFSTADFGIYSNIYAYVAFLTIVYIYGMDAAYLKYASLEEMNKKKVFSSGFLFLTATSIIISLAILIFNSPASKAMLIPAQYHRFIYYVILILLLDSLSIIPFAGLRLERKSVKFALIKLANIVINLSANLILILKYDMGIEAIFISNVIASFSSLLLLSPEIFRRLEFSIDKKYLKIMLKFAVPLLPASIAAMMVQVIDRPILLLLTDESAVGIYQANYKLGIFMVLFVMMFQYAWQPFFLNNAKEKNAKEIFSKVLTLFLIVGSIILVALSLFIKDIATFEVWNNKTLIGENFLSGLPIVPVVLLAYLFHGMYVNFVAGIYIEEKTKYFPLITGGGAVINVGVNLFLIPVWGIMGAAFATLASYIFMSLAVFFTSRKFYKIPYDYLAIVKIFFSIFAAGSVYYYFIDSITIIQKFAVLLSFILLLIVLQVIKFNEISSLAKRIFGSRFK